MDKLITEPVIIPGKRVIHPKYEIKHARRVGNTTRLINKAIDLLFEGEQVILIDYAPTADVGKLKSITEEKVIRFIRQRLKQEHNIDSFKIPSDKARIEYDDTGDITRCMFKETTTGYTVRLLGGNYKLIKVETWTTAR